MLVWKNYIYFFLFLVDGREGCMEKIAFKPSLAVWMVFGHDKIE